ncbi:DUF4381 domain-containing protein [Aquella oligotrophica]|uniref:DUF4381 domain-containing protein n=1 Tax=Aquella oligotrophica TaxID=2067065 RepID=A0A2I7N7R5_9NEIS|nr:DUF4381 domain-containing protein [Aquella oligotrophica]AUR52506.1 hypothetical protein CUN60_09410 [Aquella oligotrophica]
MDTNTNPLAELKDVHLPAPVSIFPLATGWYIVIVLIFILVAVLIWWQLRRHKKKQQQQEIFSLLKQIKANAVTTSDEKTIEECSILLKRVAVAKFPEQKPQLLFGKNWLQFLDKTGKTSEFTTGCGHYLGEIYQKQQLEDKEAFFTLIEKWLRSVI